MYSQSVLMEGNILLELNEKGHGRFYYQDGGESLGDMEVSISDSTLTVYHTEIFPKAEGKGLAKKLLDAVVDYARKNNLKVITLCPFVHAQFKRHPEEYADVWDR